MELAGLIIGAAAAIIPAYQGIDKLCGTISDTKRFSSQLENLWWQVRTHKTKLENECILLFGDDFDTDEVKAMLQDQNHPKWSDTGFQHRFKQHLGEAFDSSLGSFRVINTTLKELEEEIKKFAPTSRAGSSVADSSTAIGAPTSSKTPIKATIAKTKALAKGAAWSIQKSKLQTLQETLRSQVNDLIHLREQRTALKEFRTPTPISKTTISHGTISKSSLIIGAISNGGPLLAIREARAASDRLYQAITAVTDCQCHRIDLQLSTSVPPENSTADDKLYRLLISPLSNSTPYTCVVVRPERSNPPEGSNPAATAIQSVVQCLPKGGMKKAVSISQSCANKRKGGVRFDLSTILDPGHNKSRPEPDDLKLANAADKSQGSSQQIMTGIVLSLCPYVELRVSSVSVSAMTYFGLLPDVDSYRHVLYRAEKPRSASQISLSEVIKLVNSTSTKKSFAWPIQRRYSLAYMLALSVLCCSDSWFKENWRSEDIILVTEQQEIGDDTIKSPHITAAPRHFRPEPGMSLARSERLFSLAVALIEIGYGESLRNLYFETEVGTYGGLKMQWDCLKEYVGAKKLSTLVSAEMGGRYARVVRKCLECNFGIDEKDLDCLAMQKAFYESVVCELETCVKAFD